MCNKENLKNNFFKIIKTENKEQIKERLVIVGKSEFFDVDGVIVGCPKELGIEAQLDLYGNCGYCSQCWKNTVKHYQKVDSVNLGDINYIVKDYAEKLTEIDKVYVNQLTNFLIKKFEYELEEASFVSLLLKGILIEVSSSLVEFKIYRNLDPKAIAALRLLGYIVEQVDFLPNGERKYKVSKTNNPSLKIV